MLLGADDELEDIRDELETLAGLDEELLVMLGALELLETLLGIELAVEERTELLTCAAALELLEELAGCAEELTAVIELATLEELLAGGATGPPELGSILNQLML